MDNIAQVVYLCNIVPRVLRQYWTVFFTVQCYLDPLGQPCATTLLVQCCPKTLGTTLNSIFSCAMLSGASWTTLHKDFTFAKCCPKTIKTTLNSIFSSAVLSQASCTTLHKDFTCAMFSQEYWDSIEQFFFLCSVVSSLLDNIAQGLFLCNVNPRVSGQHWTILFSCAMLSGASWTTLHKDFTCAMLYQGY